MGKVNSIGGLNGLEAWLSGIIKAVIIGFWGIANTAQAQPANTSCRFLVDTVKVGEPCTLRISIQVSPEWHVSLEDGIAAFQPFQLMGSYTPDPIRKDGIDWYVFEYVLRTFSLDRVQAISLNYTVSGPEGQQKNTLTCSPIYLNALSSGLTPSIQAFRRKKGMVALKKPLNYSKVAFWSLLTFVVIWGLYAKLNSSLLSVYHRWKYLQSWKQFVIHWQGLRLEDRSPNAFVEQVNWAWKALLDPEGTYHLGSITRNEVEKLEHIPGIETEDLEVFDQALELEYELIFAEKSVSDERMSKLKAQLFPILKKIYWERNMQK